MTKTTVLAGALISLVVCLAALALVQHKNNQDQQRRSQEEKALQVKRELAARTNAELVSSIRQASQALDLKAAENGRLSKAIAAVADRFDAMEFQCGSVVPQIGTDPKKVNPAFLEACERIRSNAGKLHSECAAKKEERNSAVRSTRQAVKRCEVISPVSPSSEVQKARKLAVDSSYEALLDLIEPTNLEGSPRDSLASDDREQSVPVNVSLNVLGRIGTELELIQSAVRAAIQPTEDTTSCLNKILLEASSRSIEGVYVSSEQDLLKEHYRECITIKAPQKSTACGFNSKRHPSCGVELHFERATDKCGVQSYKSGSGPVCKPKHFHRCRTAACGWHRCGFVKKCKPKECEAPPCGVRAWSTCVHPSFGVAAYNSCRHPAHGVERYKECALPEFGWKKCG